MTIWKKYEVGDLMSFTRNSGRSRRVKWLRSIARRLGYVIAPINSVDEYGAVSWYEDSPSTKAAYLQTQKFASADKFNKSWARQETCAEITEIVGSMQIPLCKWMCHGVRRGLELEYFSAAGVTDVLGTDLYVPPGSDSKIVEHDFMLPLPERYGQFNFVYSNSVDHATNIVEVLTVWGKQLTPVGYIGLEMDWGHGPAKSNDLDIQGIPLSIFPFWLLLNSKNSIRVQGVHRLASNPDRYLFLLQPVSPPRFSSLNQ